MTRGQVGVGVVLAGCLTLAVWPSPSLSSSATTRQGAGDGGAWVALGDSYASGEGIPGTVGRSEQGPRGGPGLISRHCERATGVNTNATAWAAGAYEQTQEELGLDEFAFVACTGAVSDEAVLQFEEAESAFRRDDWDVVSLGFGGNNIRFAEVLKGCLDVANAWDVFDLTPGCDVTERQLRRRVDMLVGSSPIDSAEYAAVSTLPEILDIVADHVSTGGDVLVTGYPHLVEEVARWSAWRRLAMEHCSGIRDYDVPMLRSVTGYLNQQIGQAVIEADQRHRSSGVRFHFIDISRDPYEYSDDPGARHGLCSHDPWLNGVTTGIEHGDWWELERSFHPRQEGHTNTARVVARYIREEVSLDDGSASPEAYAELVGCDDNCDVTGLIEFDHPSWGPTTLVTTAPPDTECGDVTITAVDDDQDIRWRYEQLGNCFYEMFPVGTPDEYLEAFVDDAEDTDGNLYVNYNPGRYNGIIVLRPTDDGFEDFDTLPPQGDYQGRFYYAEVVAETDGGSYIVELSANDCVPGCAGGTVTTEQFVYGGDDFGPA